MSLCHDWKHLLGGMYVVEPAEPIVAAEHQVWRMKALVGVGSQERRAFRECGRQAAGTVRHCALCTAHTGMHAIPQRSAVALRAAAAVISY